MIQPSNFSRIELMALLPASERKALLSRLTDSEARDIQYSWRWNARPNQLQPGSAGATEDRNDWRYWLALAGRGWGKTRVGAETVRQWAENPTERILMIAPTAADVRDVMIEGESGLMACYPPHAKPIYYPALHRVQFPSGAVATLRSADEPERLRGPQFRKFWADELCAWRFAQEAWDQIAFGFRKRGADLRGIITTTPKPIKLIKWLVANKRTVVTRGSSYENRLNLADEYYADVIAPYEGTRLGRQEINAEILEDVQGALWIRALIDDARVDWESTHANWARIVRIVIAVDPAVTANPDSDETGIIVVALLQSRHALVLADFSGQMSTDQWATKACEAYQSFRADLIVAERNQGGDLVESSIRTAAERLKMSSIPYKGVWAKRGKLLRAEPVSMLYEQGRVHHVGTLDALEDEMCTWTPQGDEPSPNRLDALVYGITELLIDNSPGTLVQPMGTPFLIT